ncbi:MAG: NAD(P)H-quinone oxidoreductase [Alphaproteobacteria bacterium]|nr:NAD(P)H-quinone oxidoreductase [Alphaproteobacteria bacterium]TAD86607.1 MAG: NAD(P)H-quinone oxidoreductase [Alphaproteobacteria bacterium]
MLQPLPETMLVVEIVNPGGPEVLRAVSRPVPKPSATEVLIKVEAAGVNRPDVAQREGRYPPPPGASDIPGLEVAGKVVAVGSAVRRWHLGDTVCALVASGGYAEYCVAPAVQCLPVPQGLDMVQAAALPETFFTVWHNVFQRGRLSAGEWLLVHGGASGIGTTAIQLATAFGAQVITTVGAPDKIPAMERLGAVRVVDHRADDFVAVVRDVTNGRGVDVVLDMVGGSYIARNIEALAVDGRLVQIAFLQGPKVELSLLPVMTKRLTITGSTLRPRTVEAKGAMAAELEAKVWPMIASGRIRPVIHATFPLTDAEGAHRVMESSRHIGKIVLVP